MKTTIKTFVALLALSTFVVQASAQDTVYGKVLPGNYYSSFWEDSAFFEAYQYYTASAPKSPMCGWMHMTDDSLTVYGIAVGMGRPLDFEYDTTPYLSDPVVNPSREAMNDDTIRLWQAYSDPALHDGTFQAEIVGTLAIPLSQMPDYYWDFQFVLASWDRAIRPAPMYERYFDTPIIVHDTFIVGLKSMNGKNTPGGGMYTWWTFLPRFIPLEDAERVVPLRWPLNYAEYRKKVITHEVIDKENDTVYEVYDTTLYFWRRSLVEAGFVPLFPIITPNPDTNRTQDSLGIGRMTPVERNTVVSPNPATGVVRVASGFGLQHIEVYDAAGRRVYAADATGLQTHIDVGSWPRGAYTVHVRTAVGTAIKKLLLQ